MTEQVDPSGSSVIALDSFPQPGLAVVFGASGGIGGALVEALVAARRFEQVIGFSRRSTPAIDLLDEASLAQAATVRRCSHAPSP